jgi:hypothetical protein
MIHDFTKGIAVTSYTKCKFASYPLDSVDKAYQKARNILDFDATAKVTVWRDGKAIAEFGDTSHE